MEDGGVEIVATEGAPACENARPFGRIARSVMKGSPLFEKHASFSEVRIKDALRLKTRLSSFNLQFLLSFPSYLAV